jgi:hypothetical protein
MSKTRRRNIKKRNTRRKKSSLFYKNKTNSATRAYKNRNKQRKTKHRRSQRGGGIKLVGIDKETGEHIYWSTTLNEYIRVPPLPSPGKKVAPNQVAILEKFVRDLPDAGIVDAKGLAFVRDIKLRDFKQQVRALPEPGKKQIPQSVLDKEQEEKDKIFTKHYAEFIEKQKIKETEDLLDEELALYEPAMFADEADSKKSRKPPSYLLTSTDLGKSSSRKSPGAMAMASAAKMPGSPKQKRLSYSDFGLNSDDDLGDDSDLGHSPVLRKLSSKPGENVVEVPFDMELAKLDAQNKKMTEFLTTPFEGRKREQLVKAKVVPPSAKPVKYAAAKGLIQRFNELKEKVAEMLDRDSLSRLTKILPMLKLSQKDTEALLKGVKNPCLQKYFLYRSEGRQPGQFSLTVSDLVRMDGKLKSCKDMRALLSSEGMLPLDQTLWVPDSQCSHSAIGGEKFGVFTRRHHCRCCGRCVTNEYMEQNTNPKICTECSRLIGSS